MPYSASDTASLPTNVQKMGATDRRQWVATWNSTYQDCIDGGGAKGTCEAKAFRTANGVIKNKKREVGMDIEELWEKIKALFQPEVERAVVDVASWDGSASNYSDTAAYCKACLINLNTGAEADWTQDLCKLPVKKPGGTAMVKQALHAAAAALGGARGGIKKPGGVDQGKWDAAVKSAANKIISGYNQAGEQAPDAVYEKAGKTAPQRAISMGTVNGQVYDAIWAYNDRLRADALAQISPGQEEPHVDYLYPVDTYYDNGQLFCIAQMAGKLYRMDIDAGDAGATLGTMTEVAPAFNPVARGKFRVIRAADGAPARWLNIAASAALNRVGEIDSKQLFDNFVRRANESGQWPILTFWHEKESVRFGQADWLAREGDLYLASGTWDDTPIAQAALAGIEAQQNYWGTSIGYRPEEEPEFVEIADNIRVPVYRDGTNSEISILPEQNAASFFTTIGAVQEVKRMKREVYEQLVKLVGEEQAKPFAALVDETNDQIREAGMVTREGEKPAGEPAPASPPAAAPSSEAAAPSPASGDALQVPPPQLILDDATMVAIAEKVAVTEFGKSLKEGLDAAIAQLTQFGEGLKALQPLQTQLGEVQSSLETRLKKVEATDEEKKRQWQADLPKPQTVVVTHRPSEARKEGAEEEKGTPASEVAKGTLAKMQTGKQMLTKNLAGRATQ